jgi:hypothetical protein
LFEEGRRRSFGALKIIEPELILDFKNEVLEWWSDVELHWHLP